MIAGHGVSIGVIATPAAAAQAVCERLVAAGVTSILNFAPVVLSVPPGVDVRKVDLSIELQILAFHAQRRAVVRVNGSAPAGERRRRSADVGCRAVSAAHARGRWRHEPARGRPQPQERAGGDARAGRADRRRARQAAARRVPRGRRRRVAGGQHLQPGRGLRRGGQVPLRRVLRSASCWRGTPRSRWASSPRTCTCTTRTARSSTCCRWPAGSTRWWSARARSSARCGRLCAWRGPGHARPFPVRPRLARAARGQAGAHRDRNRPGGREPGERRAHRRGAAAARPGKRPGRTARAGGRFTRRPRLASRCWWSARAR